MYRDYDSVQCLMVSTTPKFAPWSTRHWFQCHLFCACQVTMDIFCIIHSYFIFFFSCKLAWVSYGPLDFTTFVTGEIFRGFWFWLSSRLDPTSWRVLSSAIIISGYIIRGYDPLLELKNQTVRVLSFFGGLLIIIYNMPQTHCSWRYRRTKYIRT